MALFATYDKSTTPWKRRTGIYGHLPKFSWPEYEDGTRYWRPMMSYCGYLVLRTASHEYTFYYQGNPGYRGRKWQVFEKDGTPYPFPSQRIR